MSNNNAASLDPWERLEAFANRMADMMYDYDLPEDCNGIICSELDVTNEMLDKDKTSLTTAVPELVKALEMVLDADGDLYAIDFDMIRAVIAKNKG
jgi:hypothetical protein